MYDLCFYFTATHTITSCTVGSRHPHDPFRDQSTSARTHALGYDPSKPNIHPTALTNRRETLQSKFIFEIVHYNIGIAVLIDCVEQPTLQTQAKDTNHGVQTSGIGRGRLQQSESHLRTIITAP